MLANDYFCYSDKIVDVDVSVMEFYLPFTNLFAVTIHYKTGEFGLYSPTHYNWHFIRYLHLSEVVVNTSSPLLNYTFEVADSYQYHLWVSNTVSTIYKQGKFTGYYA